MMGRKGILLAGGKGTRLHPATKAVSKQLLQLYDKPLIYYPLTTLMLAGIREVVVITAPESRVLFETLLGDGQQWGMRLHYEVQPRPEGIAQAFLIAEDHLDEDGCCLVLGDNLFYGNELIRLLGQAGERTEGASLFGYWVEDPRQYGVAELDGDGRVLSLEEKPQEPRSNVAVTGLYFYDARVVEMVRDLEPSARGELEITDLNRRYLAEGKLFIEVLGRGYAWLDTGTHDALLDAANFVRAIQARQGLQIACPEEIAFRNGWIDVQQVRALGSALGHTAYGRYLMRIADGSVESLSGLDKCRP